MEAKRRRYFQYLSPSTPIPSRSLRRYNEVLIGDERHVPPSQTDATSSDISHVPDDEMESSSSGSSLHGIYAIYEILHALSSFVTALATIVHLTILLFALL